jgi:hypothetical protein
VALKSRKHLCILLENCVCIYFCLTYIYLHAHFLTEFRGTRRKFDSCIRTIAMEDTQGSYSHEEEFIGLHVSMGNVDMESNGRRDMQEPITMRSLQREV